MNLFIFSIMYSASAGMNLELSNPHEIVDVKWPYIRYAEGVFTGFALIILISDCIFQKRMTFAPILFFVAISVLYHLIAFFIFLATETMNDNYAMEWMIFG